MLKDELLAIIGPLPERAPSDFRLIGSTDCGTYVREKILIGSGADDPIPAFVLVPSDIVQPAAAVFCHHQHAGNFRLGKSEVVGLDGDPDQAYAAELVARGYVVFAPDAIGFEERNWSGGDSFTQYHEFATRLVRGETLLAKVLNDVSVGLDYLESRHDVDSKRLGFIGHSYGGRMAIWASAVDDRIIAAVSHCGCVNYADSMRREAGIQIEFCVPGIVKSFDVQDVVTLISPRALLISAATEDKWSEGAQAMYDHAKSAFPDGHLHLNIWEAKHLFTRPMREAAYAFLGKHLQ